MKARVTRQHCWCERCSLYGDPTPWLAMLPTATDHVLLRYFPSQPQALMWVLAELGL